MTTAELRAAAERLADAIAENRTPRIEDANEVALAWLAEHPADDDEPVTEEWLRGVGFANEPGTIEAETRLGILRTYREFKDREGDRRWEIDDRDVFTTFIPKQLKPKTRGAVRDLCRALGIKLRSRT